MNEKRLKEIFKEEEGVPQHFTNAIKTAFERKEIRRKKQGKKWIKIAAVVLAVGIIGIATPTIQAKIKWQVEYKEYENRRVGSFSTAVKEAIDLGYEENITMDYVYQDGIGIKINSLMITNDYYKMLVDIQLKDTTEINTDTFSYGYAVYDENKNIYGICEPIESDKKYSYSKKFYQQEGIKYNKKDIYSIQLNDQMSTRMEYCKDKRMIMQNDMHSTKGFPKSKKIYVRIFDLQYTMYEFEEGSRKLKEKEIFPLSDAEWVISIDVPEKFYERETFQYKLAKEIPGVSLTKFEITDTGCILKAKIEDFIEEVLMKGRDMSGEDFQQTINDTIYLVDGNGKKYDYYDTLRTNEEGGVDIGFSITKHSAPEKLYLHVKIQDKEYQEELIKQ